MQKQYKLQMKCFKLLIILSVSLILFVKASLACDIVLKKNAVVNGRYVTLGDIATVHQKRLSNFIIGASPYLNNSITLSRPYIRSLLLQHGMDLSICGSQYVKVTTKGIILDDSEIFSIIGLKYGTVLRKKSITLPYYSGYIFKSRLKRIDKDMRFYEIYVFKKGRLFRKIPVVIKVKSKSTLVPIASRDINSGVVISKSDITYGKIAKLPPNALLTKSIIEGRISVAFIKKGTVFTQFNTKRYKPVKMGDLVKVKVVEGNIVIYTIAKALRGGYDGDIIPIMYISSNRVRPAKIVGNKIVVVK